MKIWKLNMGWTSSYLPCSFLHNMPAIHISWNSITTGSLLQRETDMTKIQSLIRKTGKPKGHAVFQGATCNTMLKGTSGLLSNVGEFDNTYRDKKELKSLTLLYLQSSSYNLKNQATQPYKKQWSATKQVQRLKPPKKNAHLEWICQKNGSTFRGCTQNSIINWFLGKNDKET